MEFVCVYILLLCAPASVIATTYNESYALHDTLLLSYNRNIRPVHDQSTPVQVAAILYIKSIQGFDEVNEKLMFSAAIQIVWYDTKLTWKPTDHGGISRITMSYDDVWVPELTLSTSADKVVSLGKSSDRIRIDATGLMEWFPAQLFQTNCPVNVRNYPFDVQTCTISFTSLGYKAFEVNLTAGLSTIAFNVYSPSSLWEVEKSSAGTQILGSGQESEISFVLHLKRKSAYFVVNIIMPVTALSFISVLVFVLVPESGERISYSITTLLAIAVYMTIVNDQLPQSSEPVPMISYKLMVDLFVSVSIVAVAILNLRFYNRPDDRPVPACLKSMYKVLNCSRRPKCMKGKANLENENWVKTEMHILSVSLDDQEICNGNRGIQRRKELPTENLQAEGSEAKITWKMISYMFDWIAIVVYTVISLLSLVLYLGMARS